MSADAVERDLRRLRLLVMRAASDCGRAHPELCELDAALRHDDVETDRLQSLLSLLERAKPAGDDASECTVIRHDIATELRDLLGPGL